MRKTVITHVCDGCGTIQKQVRDLRKFGIVYHARGRAQSEYHNADLCDTCEGRLLAAVEPIVGSDVLGLRREQTPTKTPRKVAQQSTPR
jgi:hypothetical protein